MANEMRDRLIDLLYDMQDARIDTIADHLIENGVVVPPCKVGDTVYYIHNTHWDENYKDYIKSEKLKQGVLQVVYCPKLETNLMLEVKEFDWDLFNNWLKGEVFLTKAEAEQKLKEMRGADNG